MPRKSTVAILGNKSHISPFGRCIQNKIKGQCNIVYINPDLFNLKTNKYEQKSLSQWLKDNKVCGYIGPGNHLDIDPFYYGKAKLPQKRHPNYKRFKTEGVIYRTCLMLKIPLLLICGSMQSFGVHSGYGLEKVSSSRIHNCFRRTGEAGTMDMAKSHETIIRRLRSRECSDHIIRTKKGSLFRALLGKRRHISSVHCYTLSHQKTTVSTFPLDLCFSAREQMDRSIEGFEMTKNNAPYFSPVIGIQGHPETMKEEPFFSAFLNFSKKYHKIHYYSLLNRVSSVSKKRGIGSIEAHVDRIRHAHCFHQAFRRLNVSF